MTTAVVKCKRNYNMGEEEAAGQNATVDIDYEFVKEAKVMVDINTKFFTLFSSGES